MQIHTKWLMNRAFDVLMGGAMITSGIAIGPNLWDPTQVIGAWLLFWGGMQWLSALKRGDEWKQSELDQMRQITATGWLVLPEADGGYTAYGPEGERVWLDHWRDVEERFSLDVTSAHDRYKHAKFFLIAGVVVIVVACALTLLDMLIPSWRS